MKNEINMNDEFNSPAQYGRQLREITRRLGELQRQANIATLIDENKEQVEKILSVVRAASSMLELEVDRV
jgi:hypothetical protein